MKYFPNLFSLSTSLAFTMFMPSCSIAPLDVGTQRDADASVSSACFVGQPVIQTATARLVKGETLSCAGLCANSWHLEVNAVVDDLASFAGATYHKELNVTWAPRTKGPAQLIKGCALRWQAAETQDGVSLWSTLPQQGSIVGVCEVARDAVPPVLTGLTLRLELPNMPCFKGESQTFGGQVLSSPEQALELQEPNFNQP
jgi:hypothetical protein